MVNKKMITTTCGILITNGTDILICHPTNSTHWDIPKGRQDPGESYADSAIRELWEETGISIKEDNLVYLGVYDYKPTKQLALFKYQIDTMPDPTQCRCESKFLKDGEMHAEMDQFSVTHIAGAIWLMNLEMSKILTTILLEG